MTTGTEAYKAIRAHHRTLSEHLAQHVSAVSEAVASGQPHDPAVAGLLAFLDADVLPHALAEEQTIYQAAAAVAGLADLVSLMTGEHKELGAAAGRLADAPDGTAAVGQARQLAELFAVHVSRENDVLLPALLADEETDLVTLLADMHHYVGEAGHAAGTDEATAADAEAGQGSDAAADPNLDVRNLPPAQRHESIFAAYRALLPGTGFVLVNDHDPKPLQYQFEAEQAGQFTWDYLQSGPVEWRVRIGRAAG